MSVLGSALLDGGISADLRWLLGLTMVAYTIVLYLIALRAQKQIHDNEDYLVAGRRLPLSLAWMTLLATWFGAGTLLTVADEVRSEGVRAASLDPIGAGVCLLIAGLFIAGPIWRMNLLTVPDLFRIRFGPRSELVAAILLVPGYFGWIAVQFVALAEMLDLFFGVPVRLGILLVAVVGTGYTLMGGMWSVTLTDAIQVLLLLGGLVLLAVAVLSHLGEGMIHLGLARIWEQTDVAHRTVIPLETLREFTRWLGLFAAGALGSLPGQDLMQRVFASDSERTARRACFLAGGLYLLFGAIPVGLGLAARIVDPALESAILPVLASSFLTPAMAVVFTVALMSAVLSTIDSAILSPAGVLSQNVFARYSTRDSLQLNRWAVVFVAACSLGVAYLGEDGYSLLEGAYELTLVALFVPFVIGVHTQPASGHAAAASMLTGTLLWGIHYALGDELFLERVPRLARLELPLGLSCTAISLCTYVGVSLIASRLLNIPGEELKE